MIVVVVMVIVMMTMMILACTASSFLCSQHAPDDYCTLSCVPETGKCVLSSEAWTHITGADKDNSTPSWLQVSDLLCFHISLPNV